MWENQYFSLCWYGSVGIYIWQCFVNSFVLWHKMSWSPVWWYINGLYSLTLILRNIYLHSIIVKLSALFTLITQQYTLSDRSLE
jgi:hypothetical protein